MKNEDAIKDWELIISSAVLVVNRATGLRNKLVRENAPAPSGEGLTNAQKAHILAKRHKYLNRNKGK